MKIRGIVIILIILFGSLYLPLTINQKLVSVISAPFPKSPISWLAAGDSYSSGQGLTYRTGKCAQGLATNGNLGAWPMEAANNLMSDGLKLVNKKPKFVACTGATTDEFFTKNDNAGYPEWNPSMGKFDLVTFTFGGDNIGFSNFITYCILDLVGSSVLSLYTYELPHCPSEQATENTIKSQLAGPESTYGMFLKKVAKEVVNTGGNIVVLGYPDLIESPNLWSIYQLSLGMCQGIDLFDATEIRTLSSYLNSTIEQTVQEINNENINGVHLTFINVNTGNPSQGIPYNDPNLFEPSQGARHNLCSNQEWLNGITAYSEHFNFNCFLVSCVSFHPNQEGNNAMANLFEQVFPSLDWRGLKLSSGLFTSSVPVVDCQTSYAFVNGNPPVSVPATATVLESSTNIGHTALYVDDQATNVSLLAPSGWACAAEIGADGSTQLAVVPPSYSASTSASSISSSTIGIFDYTIPACVGCMYDLACALLPKLTMSIAQHGGPCPKVPSQEKDVQINTNTVEFEDPIGISGTGPGGSMGVVYYYPNPPSGNRYAGELECSLPSSDFGTCKQAENQFLINDGSPPWIKKSAVAPTTSTGSSSGVLPSNAGNSASSLGLMLVSLDTLCQKTAVISYSMNGCPFDGSTEIGSNTFSYESLVSNNNSSNYPNYFDLINFPTTTCNSISITFGIPNAGGQSGDTAYLEVINGTNTTSAQAPYGSVGTLKITLNNQPWSLNNSATNSDDEIAINLVALCATSSGF